MSEMYYVLSEALPKKEAKKYQQMPTGVESKCCFFEEETIEGPSDPRHTRPFIKLSEKSSHHKLRGNERRSLLTYARFKFNYNPN